MTRKSANPTAAPTIATDLFRHIASSLSLLPLPTPNQTAAGLPKKSFVESSVYRKPLSGFAGTCRGKPTLRDRCGGRPGRRSRRRQRAHRDDKRGARRPRGLAAPPPAPCPSLARGRYLSVSHVRPRCDG